MKPGVGSAKKRLGLMDSARNTEIRSAAAAKNRRFGRMTGPLSSFVGLHFVPVAKGNRRGTGMCMGGRCDG